jgi:hypothetical protein
MARSWHAEDAAAAEKAGDTYAAAFHRDRQADCQPWDASLRLRAAQGWAQAGQRHRAAGAFVQAVLANPHVWP